MDVHFGSSEITIVGTLLGAVVGALVTIFRLLLASKDGTIADVKAERDNYKKVADDAVRMMEAYAAKTREATGHPAVAPLAAVRPEHQSPVTEQEETTAHQATLRAAVTAAALELGLPARTDDSDTELVSKKDAVAAVLGLDTVSSPEPKKEGES